MTTYRAESARARLEATATAGLGWHEFCLEALKVLERAIPFDRICIGLLDPGTGLATNYVKPPDLPMPFSIREFLALEYEVADVNQFIDLARRPVGVGILDEATDGDLARSTRAQHLLPMLGSDHEMRGVVRGRGQTWGCWTVYRDVGRSGFSPAESDFMHRLEGTLELGIRQGLVASAIDRQVDPASAMAVIIFDADNEVVSATDGAEQRFAQLEGDLWSVVPMAVSSVLSAARAVAAGANSLVPQSRVRTRSGEWLSLHAGPVRDRDGITSQIAVTIETAGPARIVPLIVAAFGLTDGSDVGIDGWFADN